MTAATIGLRPRRRSGGASYGPAADGGLLVRHLARLMPEVDWQGVVLPNSSGLNG